MPHLEGRLNNFCLAVPTQGSFFSFSFTLSPLALFSPLGSSERKKKKKKMTWYLWWSTLALFLAFVRGTDAASKTEWRDRSIYQVVTDRFARANNSMAECDPNLGLYCGGDFRGLINKLDYIQELGFTAVSKSIYH